MCDCFSVASIIPLFGFFGKHIQKRFSMFLVNIGSFVLRYEKDRPKAVPLLYPL